MNRKRLVRTALVTGGTLVIALVVGIFLGSLQPQHASATSPFTYWYDTDGLYSGESELAVLPVDHDDWDDYITLNESRLDGWLISPPSSSYLDGKYVMVTFESPVTVSEYDELIDPLLAGDDGRIDMYTAVGEDENEDFIEEQGFEAPYEELFDERNDPGGSGSVVDYTLEGIISTGVYLGDDVTVSDLDALRDEAGVYLVDTTAIELMDVLTPIVSVLMDSPWHLLNW